MPASALLGLVGATGVAYATSKNPDALPAHFAVTVRVLIIAVFVGVGIYAQTSKLQTRMGVLLAGAGLYTTLWLLNGSDNRLLFSIGALFSGPALVVFAALVLLHPTGRLRSTVERRFLIGAGAAVVTLWVLSFLLASQPPVRTALLRCAPHCPASVFTIGSATIPPAALKDAILVVLIAVVVGASLLVLRRERASTLPLRRAIGPVWFITVVTGITGLVYYGSILVGLADSARLAGAFLAAAAAIPLAILVGLIAERLSMAQVLASLVDYLADRPDADPEALMSSALEDRSLRIAYRRPSGDGYVNARGEPLAAGALRQPCTLIERRGHPIAAVSYSPELAGLEPFVHAAAAAAMMRLEQTQLEAQLRASNAQLAASRLRLMEAAHAERERLERDLHDGVQQQLTALRIKLELAAEAAAQDPAGTERALESIGRQVDETLEAVRMLARGIYPALLRNSGLREALQSAARSAPVPATVNAKATGRYPESVEVAVYFCCLEALQNIAKHAGRDATAAISVIQEGPSLCFEIRDTGIGFEPEAKPLGKGLINMRDRVQAVGGTVTILSREGGGTTVLGSIPVSDAPA